MWLSPSCRAFSFQNIARASRIEGGWCSNCGSRLSVARTRVKHVQEFHGSWAGRFRNVVLALAPRTFVSSTD
eukprot:5615148-Pyramimonas_sp.AAC.1